MTSDYKKPLPDLKDEDAQPFWENLKAHKFTLQKCSQCGHIRYPILPNCPDCLSGEFEWAPLSGRGKVWSWVQFYQLYNRGWEGETPYNVTYVLLDEGIGLITNLVGIAHEDVRMEMPVEVYYDDVTPDVTLLKFQAASK